VGMLQKIWATFIYQPVGLGNSVTGTIITALIIRTFIHILILFMVSSSTFLHTQN
jgi:hypothetical protein